MTDNNGIIKIWPSVSNAVGKLDVIQLAGRRTSSLYKHWTSSIFLQQTDGECECGGWHVTNTVSCHRVTAISTNEKLSPARTLRTNERRGLVGREADGRSGPAEGTTGDNCDCTDQSAGEGGGPLSEPPISVPYLSFNGHKKQNECHNHKTTKKAWSWTKLNTNSCQMKFLWWLNDMNLWWEGYTRHTTRIDKH